MITKEQYYKRMASAMRNAVSPKEELDFYIKQDDALNVEPDSYSELVLQAAGLQVDSAERAFNVVCPAFIDMRTGASYDYSVALLNYNPAQVMLLSNKQVDTFFAAYEEEGDTDVSREDAATAEYIQKLFPDAYDQALQQVNVSMPSETGEATIEKGYAIAGTFECVKCSPSGRKKFVLVMNSDQRLAIEVPTNKLHEINLEDVGWEVVAYYDLDPGLDTKRTLVKIERK